MWSRIIDKQDSDSREFRHSFVLYDYGNACPVHGNVAGVADSNLHGRSGSIVLDDPCRYDELSSMPRRVYTGSSV